MRRASEIEAAVLALPASERERIALTAWQSLELDLPPDWDREGLELAAARDQEIESGRVETIDFEEFRRRTRSGG